MKLPKIEFRYSWVYDDKFRDSPSLKKEINSHGRPDYPEAWQIVEKEGADNIIKNLKTSIK